MIENLFALWCSWEAFTTAGNGFKPSPEPSNWEMFWFILLFVFLAWLLNTDFDDKKKNKKNKRG